MTDYASLTLNQLDAELSIELGNIESYKNDSITESAKFWGAVERRNLIRAEMQKRQPHSFEVKVLSE